MKCSGCDGPLDERRGSAYCASCWGRLTPIQQGRILRVARWLREKPDDYVARRCGQALLVNVRRTLREGRGDAPSAT